MSDYISKRAVFEVMSDVFNSYGNNALNFDEEETKAIKRFCAMLQSQIAELPTLDEKEIIRKPFERVVDRLEERHENHKNNILKYQERKDWDMCSRTSNIKVENEIAIEIVKEECGVSE